MNSTLLTVGLLIISNTFMTFAWYGHLKYKSSALWLAILASWGLAFFEYVFQVPANRIGAEAGLTLTHLKIIQECVTLTVFTIIAYFMFGETLKWNNLVSFLFLVGAVVFAFWGKE
ncbi:MAG: DMT family protein [Pyrinomonadaceae bacterium]